MDIFREQVIADKPDALLKQQIYVYNPLATYDDYGIAKYDREYFKVDSGIVRLDFDKLVNALDAQAFADIYETKSQHSQDVNSIRLRLDKVEKSLNKYLGAFSSVSKLPTNVDEGSTAVVLEDGHYYVYEDGHWSQTEQTLENLPTRYILDSHDNNRLIISSVAPSTSPSEPDGIYFVDDGENFVQSTDLYGIQRSDIEKHGINLDDLNMKFALVDKYDNFNNKLVQISTIGGNKILKPVTNLSQGSLLQFTSAGVESKTFVPSSLIVSDTNGNLSNFINDTKYQCQLVIDTDGNVSKVEYNNIAYDKDTNTLSIGSEVIS